jgi:hypothetical protein
MNYSFWLLLSVFLSIFSLYSQAVEEQKKLYISKINFSSSVPESIRSSLGNRIKLITIQRFGSKYRVVSDKDIALMNQKAAQLMKQGCDESVCMTQIADAIDADEIIYGDVFYENGSIVLSLTNLNRDKENFTLTSKSVVDLSFQEKQYEIYIKEITYKLLDPKYKMELNVIDYTDTDKKIRWDLVWRSAVLAGWGQYYYNEKFSAYLYGTLFTAGLLYNLSSIGPYNQAKDNYFNNPLFYLNAITPAYISSNNTVTNNPNLSPITFLNFTSYNQNKIEYEKRNSQLNGSAQFVLGIYLINLLDALVFRNDRSFLLVQNEPKTGWQMSLSTYNNSYKTIPGYEPLQFNLSYTWSLK